MKAATKAKASARPAQASTARAKTLPRQRGSRKGGAVISPPAPPAVAPPAAAATMAVAPGPSLSRTHRWLAIDTRHAIEGMTELLELLELMRSWLEPEKQRPAVSETLFVLRGVRRLAWRMSTDMRGISGQLTGLTCEDPLGTHIAQLASLEAYGDNEEERARFLRSAIKAFTAP